MEPMDFNYKMSQYSFDLFKKKTCTKMIHPNIQGDFHKNVLIYM